MVSKGGGIILFQTGIQKIIESLSHGAMQILDFGFRILDLETVATIET
jgi:hypothetical protein